jgi:hypothetical protein
MTSQVGDWIRSHRVAPLFFFAYAIFVEFGRHGRGTQHGTLLDAVDHQ